VSNDVAALEVVDLRREGALIDFTVAITVSFINHFL
jgi:hypothetical protein